MKVWSKVARYVGRGRPVDTGLHCTIHRNEQISTYTQLQADFDCPLKVLGNVLNRRMQMMHSNLNTSSYECQCRLRIDYFGKD